MMRRLLPVTILLLATSALAQQAALPLAPTATTPAPAGLPALPAAAPATAPSPAAAPLAKPNDSAAAVPALPALAGTTTPDPGQNFSFGTAKNSLLFTPAQIEGMKKSLTAYESLSHEVGDANPDDTAVVLAPQKKIGEPSDYPVFYLSSILYHSPTDWTVWLDRTRITPATNSGELIVTQVAADHASFRWTPPYIDAIAARYSGNTFADAHRVANRFTDPDTTKYAHGNTSVEFTLRPNQSFVSAYFHTFEGKLASPKVPGAATADAAADAGGAAGSNMSAQDAATINNLMGAQGPDPLGADRANMQQLIDNQSKVTPKSIEPNPSNVTSQP